MTTINNFGNNLLNIISNDQCVLSPFNLYIATIMMLEGSDNNTRAQILQALNVRNVDIDQVKTMVNNLNKNKDINIANAIFHRTNLKQSYIDFMDKFGTIENSIDLSHINGWVAEATKNKITEIITPNMISIDTKLVGITTIYFKGSWEKAFSKAQTRTAQFTNRDNQVTDCRLMQMTNVVKYNRNANFEVIEKPYKGNKMCMGFVLPNGIKMPSLNEVLDTHLVSTDVNYSIPIFRQESTIDVIPIFQNLGITDLFDMSSADLSRMVNERLYVNELIHKVIIEVDEVGTVASAATAFCEKRCMSPPKPYFVANRTFMWYIKDNTTNNVLFCGIYDGK